MALADPPDDTERLDGLRDLLVTIAWGETPDRLSSTAYIRDREHLLQSAAGPFLPGYLNQCVSVARFRTFIELYDCAPAERERFVRDTLAPAERRLKPGGGKTGSYDFLDDV